MTMMTMSNLPRDMLEEILTRVPLKSMRAMRLTCKTWNDFSKNITFSKMIVMIDYNLYQMNVVIGDDDVDPSMKLKGKLTCLKEQVKISQVFHCEGLLLCILENDYTKVIVWNPYCWQTRSIKPRFYPLVGEWHKFSYALGYEDKKSCRSFKLLRFIDHYYRISLAKQIVWYEIYDFDSSLWTTLDVAEPHWRIIYHHHGVTLKGNTYWCARERNSSGIIDNIICFDFTQERFGPLLPLPSSAIVDGKYTYVNLSCVGEERLAALFQQNEYQYRHELEIWITTKIETEMVSWSKFLRVDTGPAGVMVPLVFGGFFIDEEKKVAVGFNKHKREKFIVIGENGYFRDLDTRKYTYQSCEPNVCFYVPSLAQIKKTPRGERKEQSSLEKRRFGQKILKLATFAKPVWSWRMRYG